MQTVENKSNALEKAQSELHEVQKLSESSKNKNIVLGGRFNIEDRSRRDNLIF